MVKIMLYCVPLYLIIMTFSSFAIESNLKSKGYSYCYWYTGPSFREADVWLKNSDFCLQEGSVHISTVRGYFEKLKLEGLEPKLSELKQVLAVENEKRDKLLNR